MPAFQPVVRGREREVGDRQKLHVYAFVDMRFRIGFTPRSVSQIYRRKEPRQCGRGAQDAAKQLVLPCGGDGAHVPDRGPRTIKFRGDNEQALSRSVLFARWHDGTRVGCAW